MGKRRFAQMATSDDEEEQPKGSTCSREEEEGEEEEEEEEAQPEDAKPIGEPVRVSGKGRRKKMHFEAFEYDGNRFELEDSVLLTPEVDSETPQKPYVAIIKDITQDSTGNMMVTGQWFYRPEEAEKKGGGSWQPRDTRELFYSFHLDEVPAESVMHKCVVHFVPLNKQLPLRSQHPGFIVQRVYDTVERKLWKLTDKDYEDKKQHEIDLLVKKTRERIGELPDIEPEEACPQLEDNVKSKRLLRRKNVSPLDVSRNEETCKTEVAKAETPGSAISEPSEFHNILSNFKCLTGETHRDKWLEKLMQGIQSVCTMKEDMPPQEKSAKGDASEKGLENTKALQEEKKFLWPDDTVPAVTALERAAHQSLGSDFLKYNQKMRQLVFNLKNNRLLARRLLNKELEPSVILNMSPAELKDGLTADERVTKEPERPECMQMTDATCPRCKKKQVGVADIIHAGGSGDRYQLECIACGNTWYSSRDAISSLTIETPNAISNVGTAPWATAKFEDVEKKKILSPRESEKPAAATGISQKTTEPTIPVLDKQKSFSKVKAEDTPATAVPAK